MAYYSQDPWQPGFWTYSVVAVVCCALTPFGLPLVLIIRNL